RRALADARIRQGPSRPSAGTGRPRHESQDEVGAGKDTTGGETIAPLALIDKTVSVPCGRSGRGGAVARRPSINLPGCRVASLLPDARAATRSARLPVNRVGV